MTIKRARCDGVLVFRRDVSRVWWTLIEPRQRARSALRAELKESWITTRWPRAPIALERCCDCALCFTCDLESKSTLRCAIDVRNRGTAWLRTVNRRTRSNWSGIAPPDLSDLRLGTSRCTM